MIPQPGLQQHGLDVRDHHFFKDFNIDEVTPVEFKDCAGATLVEPFEGS